ncbi:VanZ family protein [Cryptosporangium sp. NPDC048952]|uniref:VanZ family protein n=1 Tax=Cryptosporangium sp. NPDC048952 TaxID=3363961 RepID=UPI00371D2B4D
MQAFFILGDAMRADAARIVPLVVVALAALAVGWRPTARKLGLPGLGLALTLATILVITLAPAPAVFANDTSHCIHGGWQPTWMPWPINGRSLNVWMFVPLGAFAALTRRKTLIMAGMLLPLSIEAAQRLLPLSRFCDTRDVADNVYGFLLGLALATLARYLGEQHGRRHRRVQ